MRSGGDRVSARRSEPSQDASASIRAISDFVSSKSKRAKFSSMRSRRAERGMTTKPCSRCQRRMMASPRLLRAPSRVMHRAGTLPPAGEGPARVPHRTPPTDPDHPPASPSVASNAVDERYAGSSARRRTTHSKQRGALTSRPISWQKYRTVSSFSRRARRQSCHVEPEAHAGTGRGGQKWRSYSWCG